jgi:hypothetical protein
LLYSKSWCNGPAHLPRQREPERAAKCCFIRERPEDHPLTGAQGQKPAVSVVLTKNEQRGFVHMAGVFGTVLTNCGARWDKCDWIIHGLPSGA